MVLDERARHRLYLRLEEVLGKEEAGTLMNHLPATGWGDVTTKKDLDILEHKLTAKMEHLARQVVVWMSGMVLATGGFAFAAGRLL